MTMRGPPELIDAALLALQAGLNGIEAATLLVWVDMGRAEELHRLVEQVGLDPATELQPALEAFRTLMNQPELPLRDFVQLAR